MAETNWIINPGELHFHAPFGALDYKKNIHNTDLDITLSFNINIISQLKY